MFRVCYLCEKAVSFVDRDMIMRYFGGGVGHLKNAPPQQAHRSDPVDPDSEEMEVEDEEGNTGGNTRGDSQDIFMSNGELEVGEDDEEKGENIETDVRGDVGGAHGQHAAFVGHPVQAGAALPHERRGILGEPGQHGRLAPDLGLHHGERHGGGVSVSQPPGPSGHASPARLPWAARPAP